MSLDGGAEADFLLVEDGAPGQSGIFGHVTGSGMQPVGPSLGAGITFRGWGESSKLIGGKETGIHRTGRDLAEGALNTFFLMQAKRTMKGICTLEVERMAVPLKHPNRAENRTACEAICLLTQDIEGLIPQKLAIHVSIPLFRLPTQVCHELVTKT